MSDKELTLEQRAFKDIKDFSLVLYDDDGYDEGHTDIKTECDYLCDIVDEGLLRLEKQDRIITLCRDKEIDLYVLLHARNVQEYNYSMLVYGADLTEEEFKELKEVFNKVKKEDK